MRENPVKQALAGGGKAFGAFLMEFDTPGISAILAAAGAEFVVLDMEHSGWTNETIKRQIAYARGLDIVPIVRIPATQYHLIAGVLDCGAMGIMAPMVESVEQAEFLVSCTRYPSDGIRGAAFNVAHDDYATTDVAETMRIANERCLVIAQIETATGVDNVDGILATNGIDVGWIGHFDLSNFLGIPGQFDHPDFLSARQKVLDACEKHGVAPGYMASNIEVGKQWLADGTRIIAYGSDIGIYQNAVKAGLQQLRE